MKNKEQIAELKRIANANGGILDPKHVVKYAEDEDSPLHSWFEWDDGKAAHDYRLWQARKLIRVSVEYLQDSKNPVKVFVSLTTDRKEGGYRVMNTVLSMAESRSQLLSDAFTEMEFFKKKYRQLRELSEVFAAMDKTTKKLSKKRSA